jgi:hypothetical protein
MTSALFLVNYPDLKASLRGLPGYTAVRAAVGAHVNAVAPRLNEADVMTASHGFPPAAAALRAYRSLVRTGAKMAAWHYVASVLAGEEAVGGLGSLFDAIYHAAVAMREAGEEAAAIGIAALDAQKDTVLSSMPAINDEAF